MRKEYMILLLFRPNLNSAKVKVFIRLKNKYENFLSAGANFSATIAISGAILVSVRHPKRKSLAAIEGPKHRH